MSKNKTGENEWTHSERLNQRLGETYTKDNRFENNELAFKCGGSADLETFRWFEIIMSGDGSLLSGLLARYVEY